jgi:hemerythrin
MQHTEVFNMSISWNDSYSVGIDSIDQQHFRLFELLDDLSQAFAQGRVKESLGKSIDELISYTKTHFATEEKYFNTYNYPMKDAHKKEHDAFIEKVADFKKRYDEGRLTMTVEIKSFLYDWLIKHIKGSDKAYSAFLIEKGVV